MPAVAPAFAETSDILVAPGAPPPSTPKEVAKEQPVEVAADPLDSPTKKLAPDDFCHIFNAKENVLNGVKMSPEEVKANAAVDPPKIDLALVELEAVASAEDAPKKVEEIAPADYIQIYSAKEGPVAAAAAAGAAPPAAPALADATSKAAPSTDVLKKAVNENVVNAGKDNEKH
ncbi:hypothetical protein TYRP_014293 [Tyrophagus putrescentiae]|nr:hypothetical protein TYRP_014293 [Tyrophagus putrescentiae]